VPDQPITAPYFAHGKYHCTTANGPCVRTVNIIIVYRDPLQGCTPFSFGTQPPPLTIRSNHYSRVSMWNGMLHSVCLSH